MTESHTPIFIKANLKFSLAGEEFTYQGAIASMYGVSALRVTSIAVQEIVGADVTVAVEALGFPPYEFETPAQVTAELTIDHWSAGLKFSLPAAVRDKLAGIIRKDGFYPSEYARKYPRIPADSVIPTMPLHAILITENGDLIVFDIANMSPGGILLYTENAKATMFTPNFRLRGQIEPRGAGASFEFDGTVSRVMLERNPESGNLRRYLGIRFSRIPEEHKKQFHEILRVILTAIQQSGMVDK